MTGPMRSAPSPAATIPEVVIQRIADYRSEDKADPNYYADHTVAKAQAQLNWNDKNQMSPTALESPIVTQR